MKKEKTVTVIKGIVLLFLIISVIFPIVTLVSNIDVSNFGKVVSSTMFKESLVNSISVTSISTIISITIAYLLAYAVNRTNIKRKALLSLVFILPMLIPSISHGMGLINLFGTNGLINTIFNTNISILGFQGIIVGSVLYTFPVAFLIFTDAFKYIDNTLYESALVLGLTPFQTFQKITWTYMKKSLISSVFVVFTMIFTDYGVPLAVGARYNTLPVYLYREVIGLLDFSKGTIIGMFLLIPALISFVFDAINNEVKNINFETKEFRIRENKKRDLFFKIFILLIIFLEAMIFISFIIIAFIKKYPYDYSFSLDHFFYVFNGTAGKTLINSLIISILVAFIGTICAYCSAYITARIKSGISRIIHILSISSIAIPGIVLGIAYAMSFRGTIIYGTIIILMIVNIVHFFASPYLMAYNALGKVNQNLEVVGQTCGLSRLRIILNIIIPCTKETIIEMLSYFFVNSMITISAVTFLFKSKNMPISLLINQYEGQMMLEEAAIVSLTILVVNIIVKGISYIYERRNHRRGV